MAHIINPNTQTLNNSPLNIRMEGDPGSTPTVISPEYIYVNSDDSEPNKSTKALSLSENSVSNALKSIVTTKSTDSNTLLTKIVWNANTNTIGSINPTIFGIKTPGTLSNTALTSTFGLQNNILSTWIGTSDTRGDRAFNNIFISGKVISDEDDANINEDANENPIYLSGVLSDDDESQDQEIKDSLAIPAEDGIVFQECYNYDEPKLTINFKTNSSWFRINGNSSYAYTWTYTGRKEGDIMPLSDLFKISYSVTANTPTSSEGTVSGTVDTVLSNNLITYDGGTAQLNIGNTKSNGAVTGFTFTNADNSHSTVASRTAVITYTYSTANSDPEFKGRGSFKVTQEGGDVTTPNPTITYYFSNTVNCTLSKTSQGPQDKSGNVGSVVITAKPNSATKGKVSFNSGSKASIYYGSSLIGESNSTTSGTGNIGVIGGTYTLKVDNVNVTLPVNTSKRDVSFDIDIIPSNDAYNGSHILNTPITWTYSQPGFSYVDPLVKFAYGIEFNESTIVDKAIVHSFNAKTSNFTGQVDFQITPNTGKYQGATTDPVISIDKTSTITVADNGGTISVNCSYTGGTWEPGYTKSTDARNYVVRWKSFAVNNSVNIDTTNAPMKSITLTQAGATEGGKQYSAVTISGSNPNTSYCTSVNSCTLNDKTSKGSVQYTFTSASQPTRNGFKMELIDDDYTCGDITIYYTKPSGTFTSLSSTLTISAGSLNTTTVKFTRPTVYPSNTISFTSSNSNLVHYKNNATWTETFDNSNMGETYNWTVNDSARNIYYTNPSITSGSCSAGDGSSTFSGSVVFTSSQSGSSSDVSSTITATDQDGNKQTVTVTRSAYNKTGLSYSIECSNSAWTITSKPSSISTSGTLSFSGTINTTTAPVSSASSCTITVKIYSSSNSNLIATKQISVCRKGKYTDGTYEYKWVNNGNSTTTYSMSSGISLSCTASGGGNIDYWTSSATVSAYGSVSTTDKNVTITTIQPQKQQSRGVGTTHIVDCSGNDTTTTDTGGWADNGQTKNVTTTSFTSSSQVVVQKSTDGTNWEDGSSYSVTPTAGSNGSSTGTAETRYFRTVLKYNGQILGVSSVQSVSVAKYGVSYYNQ